MKFITLVLTLLTILPAFAHKPSDSFLKLKAEGNLIRGQIDLALKDLTLFIALDENGDGAITWGELKKHHSAIEKFAFEGVSFSSAGAPCGLKNEEHLVDDHSDGAYAVLRFTATCPNQIEEIEIDYTLFFNSDAQHRGLATLEAGKFLQTAIFTSSDRTKRLLAGEPSVGRQFREFLWQGVIHIWMGFDHILFLIVLLLPAVLKREKEGWVPVKDFAEAFFNVLKIVTSFTLAHSITLSLAALNIVTLPSRLVECTIAVSVFLAALNNIFPVVKRQQWLIAFFFGLIHGFGFASVLVDLGLSSTHLAVTLIAFNIGVELGQLAIVTVFLPTVYLVRSKDFYRRYSFYAGSVAAALMAVVWFIERAGDLKILP